MSNLLVQNIKHTNGTTSMVVNSSGHVATDTIKGNTSTGSISVVAEGGTNTTNLQQGLAKVWSNLNGTGTIATRDSFNVSGHTDVGAGNYTTNYTNAMSSANQSAGCFARVSGKYGIFAGNADATFTTTSFIYQALTYDNGSTGTDPEDALIITFNLCGDLA
tara:strand:- start:42 stop:527 length:486 start_codon:yes stop_codon:yes gene_type:complete